jgi:hypothetical protein
MLSLSKHLLVVKKGLEETLSQGSGQALRSTFKMTAIKIATADQYIAATMQFYSIRGLTDHSLLVTVALLTVSLQVYSNRR